jgi:hypothetical protein
MRTLLAAVGLAAAAVLTSGCGESAVPDAVYKFRLAAQPVTLAAADACQPLNAMVATAVDAQLLDIPGSQKRWESSRGAVMSLMKQGIERLEQQARVAVCEHPDGRVAYGALCDAVSRMARALGKSRSPYLDFGYALEPDEILAARLGAPRSNLSEERDKRMDAVEKQIDALLATTCRLRVEQARLFLSAGDSTPGYEAAADALAIIAEFSLDIEEFKRIGADAAKLAGGSDGAGTPEAPDEG